MSAPVSPAQISSEATRCGRSSDSGGACRRPAARVRCAHFRPHRVRHNYNIGRTNHRSAAALNPVALPLFANT